jgi:lactobin A/cerein 7B family class IIb bacteriocin
MINSIELTDLNNEELLSIDGGFLPLLAVPLLIKGIAVGFTAAAAVYGMIAIGNQMQ